MLYRRFPIISVLLALAVVFSLVGGALAFSRASMAQQTPLSVSFVTPTPPQDTFIPVCTNFIIMVHIQNNATSPADNVTAQIMLLQGPGKPGAELISGANPQNNPSIPAGGSWNPQWTWHCLEVGQASFQVTVSANGQDDIYVYDSFWQGKPHLKVAITAPQNGVTYTPCTTFQVTTTVTNTGQLPAEGTTATIGINGPASLVNDTVAKPVGGTCVDQFDNGVGQGTPSTMNQFVCIPPQGSFQVGWTLHCDGPGDVVITVTPDGWMSPPIVGDDEVQGNGQGDGPMAVKIYAANLEKGSIIVHQVPPPLVPPPQTIGEVKSSPSPCVDRPGCAVCFAPSINVMPKELSAGQPVTITVSALNNCETAGIFAIPLKINGKVEQTQTVEISPHGSFPVQFTVVKNEPGTYTVNFDNYKASFVVEGSVGAGNTTSRNLVIPVIAIGFLAIILVALVMLVRRRPA